MYKSLSFLEDVIPQDKNIHVLSMPVTSTPNQRSHTYINTTWEHEFGRKKGAHKICCSRRMITTAASPLSK